MYSTGNSKFSRDSTSFMRDVMYRYCFLMSEAGKPIIVSIIPIAVGITIALSLLSATLKHVTGLEKTANSQGESHGRPRLPHVRCRQPLLRGHGCFLAPYRA